jgi:hypothetical protein
MRRFFVLVALFLPCAVSARVTAPSAGAPGMGGGSPLGREALLAISTGINAAASSIVVVELATGRKQLALSGVSLIVTAPTAIYLLDQVRHDPGDVLMIGAAAWSAALATRAIIDLIRHHDPTTEISNRRVIIQPMFEPGTGGKPIGVDFSGQF